MGWQNAHLHEFTVGDRRFGTPDPEYEEPVANDSRVRLAEVAAGLGSTVRYAYDFGDDWQHNILVEDIRPATPGVSYPICLGGERACPPEDCGGAGGYEEFLAAIQDPAHEEHEDMLMWIGGSFDPEAFNVDHVNKRLRRSR